jgi:cytochrome c peroxidase
MPATRRIPVLPLWIHRTRLYGEARFEEADGNYLLYLACNEAFKKNGNPEHPSQVDPVRTADTSGRSSRAICNLLDGASFAQEAWGDPDEDDPIIKYQNGQPVPRMNAQALRLEMWPGPETSLQYHENIGFKGRAIVFPTAGYVQVTGGPLYAGPSSPYGASGSVVTFQAFVKPMRSWAAQQLTILKDTGHFALKLKTNGQFRAEVTVRHGGTLKTKVVESRLDAVTSESDEFDPTAGWRHVAVTFDGNDANGKSVLWMYLDGQPEDSTVWTGESHFEGPATDVSVGPRINGGVTNPQSAVLVLDEVAISDVLRTDDEIRRDACVAPWPTGFQHVWPPMADVTIPQEWVARVSWPNGVTYSAAKVALGRDLFFDPILSEPGSRLDSDPTSPISCALCHEPQHGFAEAQALAGSSNPAVQALFNTPTVLNSAFGRHKMFNGRAASLEDQVVLPLTSGKEMGSQSIAQVIGRLNGASSPYGARFTGIYGGGATANRLAEVLAMYQRTLVSKDAPFDAAPGFPAFTAEQRGRALFFGKARCFGCHRGPAFTDDDFHNIQTVTQSSLMDLGKATGRGTDDGKLKTPTLRNIAKTGPYFHDGSRATLAEVIDHYDGGFLSVPGAIGVPDLDLLPIELTAGEESDLEQFLLSLSGTDPN